MNSMDALKESDRLLTEARSYMDRGLVGGVAWRLADSLYWLKVSMDNDSGPHEGMGGIHTPTGLGNILHNVYDK